MEQRSMFVGMDVHKESIDISLAEEGRRARFGLGRRSPASCSTTNRSNGLFVLNALMTQSR